MLSERKTGTLRRLLTSSHAKWTVEPIVVLLMLVILAGSSVAGQQNNTPAEGVASEDPPGTHNMLVVGKEAVFLSHLPMFDGLNRANTDYTSPHRYQVILEVSFTLNGKDVTDIYTKDRTNNPGTKMYTLNPGQFVLSRLFTPDAQNPVLSSFEAEIFRGHLERGGQTIDGLKNVVVTVKKVVHAQKFDPAGEKPEKLEYFLFGKGEELFLAHLITKPPDFDQILSVKVTDHQVTEEELNRGVSVIFRDRGNTAPQRVKENEQIQGKLHLPGTDQFVDLKVDAGTEYYFEEGELAMPPTFKQTPEEGKAGF
jgi:hypothetical protein